MAYINGNEMFFGVSFAGDTPIPEIYSWEDIPNKPFEYISEDDFKVDNNILKLNTQITSSLPILYFLNDSEKNITSNETEIAKIIYRLDNQASFIGNLLINFQANSSLNFVVSIKSDGIDEVYSPVSHQSNVGNSSIGIPLTFVEKSAGDHSISIFAHLESETAGATAHILANNIVFSIAGNITGSSVEPPHAEITETYISPEINLENIGYEDEDTNNFPQRNDNSTSENYEYSDIDISDIGYSDGVEITLDE